MKQLITQKQWDEISPKEQNIYCGIDKDDDSVRAMGFMTANIGQMIEFLGDVKIEPKNVYGLWVAEYKACRSPENELCDSLWEAVKYKLKKS